MWGKGTASADEHGAGGKTFERLFEATGELNKDKELLIGFEFYGEGDFFLVRGHYHLKSQSPDRGGWAPTLNGDFENS